MNAKAESTRGYSRRDVLKLSGAMAAWGAVGGIELGSGTAAAAFTKNQRDNWTPDEILAAMKKGNERFRQGKLAPQDFLAQQRATAGAQYPDAVLLSCIDSRAPAEIILDLGIGDIFNCRVAGAVDNPDILGSIEYGCKVAGAKVVLVMGHTNCGAVKGAIDGEELGNLTGLLAKIKPAIAATTYVGDRTTKNPAFVNAVCRRNVELVVDGIPKRSPVLAEMAAAHTIRIAGALYHLDTGTVEFL
jgi:carbonic anhydrase